MSEIRQCPDRGETDVRRQNLVNRIFEGLGPFGFTRVQNSLQEYISLNMGLGPFGFTRVQNRVDKGQIGYDGLEPFGFTREQNRQKTALGADLGLEPFGFIQVQNKASSNQIFLLVSDYLGFTNTRRSRRVSLLLFPSFRDVRKDRRLWSAVRRPRAARPMTKPSACGRWKASLPPNMFIMGVGVRNSHGC